MWKSQKRMQTEYMGNGWAEHEERERERLTGSAGKKMHVVFSISLSFFFKHMSLIKFYEEFFDNISINPIKRKINWAVGICEKLKKEKKKLLWYGRREETTFSHVHRAHTPPPYICPIAQQTAFHSNCIEFDMKKHNGSFHDVDMVQIAFSVRINI